MNTEFPTQSIDVVWDFNTFCKLYFFLKYTDDRNRIRGIISYIEPVTSV